MIDLGGYIREKLDKRAWSSDHVEPEDFIKMMETGEWERTDGEVIGPMERFITLWKEINK